MTYPHRHTRTAASAAFGDVVDEAKYFDCFLVFSQISISIHSLSVVHVGNLVSGKTRSKLEHAINLHHSIVRAKRHGRDESDFLWDLVGWGLPRGHLNDILGDTVRQKLYWSKTFYFIQWGNTAISESKDVFSHSWNCRILLWMNWWNLVKIIYKDLPVLWQTLRIIFLEKISFVGWT